MILEKTTNPFTNMLYGIKFDSMVLTKTVAAIVIETDAKNIQQITRTGQDVEVLTWGNNYYTSTVKEFIEAFGKKRKKDSVNLKGVQDKELQSLFHIQSSTGQETYQLIVHAKGITCTCPDHQNQLEAFGGVACCKHNYWVLDILGFETLRDFIAFVNSNGYAALWQTPEEGQRPMMAETANVA